MIDATKYGPWAVITGGSEGIGATMAGDLAESGINVVLIARKPEPLQQVADHVRAKGVRARTLSLDLTDPAMLDQVREVTDDIEVGFLAYTAGSTHRTGPLVEWALEDVIKVIRLNVDGQAVLSHYFGGRMVERGRGAIILFGSNAGVAGSPTVAPYAGAKAFSQIFSESLRWEMKQHGVDVLHVIVGATNTPAMERLGIVYPGDMGVGGDEVARFALENITNGPVVVMPHLVEAVRERTITDRRAATEMNASRIMATTKTANN